MIIDVQNDFCSPGGYMDHAGADLGILRKPIGAIRAVLDAARRVGMPVIYTREGHRPGLETLPDAFLERTQFVGHTVGFPGVAAYAASKAGLIGLTQALAAEYGPQGIRVNAVLPGAVETPMYASANDTAESQSFITGLHALKRVAQPEELARSVLYLASDASSFQSGTAMLVDGGLSVTRT